MAYAVRDVALPGTAEPAPSRGRAARVAVFLIVFLTVALAGLAYDYSRPGVYRAVSRLSVEPPDSFADAVAKAQFALTEAQALRRSDLLQAVAGRLRETAGVPESELAALESRIAAEAIAQTNVIELRVEGYDRAAVVSALSALIEVYQASRKEADKHGESEALAEAREAVRRAQKAVEDKRREIDAFRQRHGITSIEREENPGAARLKGLHSALNEASTREVNAEARLKAITDSLAHGEGVIRAADKAAIANLEMRAVDLREKLKDLEHDYTQQYLALDPKFKALKANLARVEQQIEREKEKSRKAALLEAQEDYAGAQRAVQKIREQADALKQENQAFSGRFGEFRRMAADYEQLQDASRAAAERLARLESARKPATAKIQVLSAPAASEIPISPNYTRDAAYALGGGLILAIGAVWIMDYLRRDPGAGQAPVAQPVIQIAYPLLQPQPPEHGVALAPRPAQILASSLAAPAVRELTTADVSALWSVASQEGRLILAALLAGIAPSELAQLRWRHVNASQGTVDVPGPSARALPLLEPLRRVLDERAIQRGDAIGDDSPLLADGMGARLDEAAIDETLAYLAHDAGVRHPEEVTGQALHFTYAAFLARQGMRMTEIAATMGRLSTGVGQELMRLAPPRSALSLDAVDRVYPSLRSA